MKKKLLPIAIFGASLCSLNAQIVYQDNFNSYTLGNLNTVTDYVTPVNAAQGSFILSASKSAAESNINADAFTFATGSGTNTTNVLRLKSALRQSGGNAFQLYRSEVKKDALAAAWAGRTAGNNTIQLEFKIYNSPSVSTTPDASAGQLKVELAGTYSNGNSFGVGYIYQNLVHSTGSVDSFVDNSSFIGSSATTGTWSNVMLKIDFINKNQQFFLDNVLVNSGSFNPGTATDFTPNTIKIKTAVPYNPFPENGSYAQDTFMIDDLKLTATSESILSTNILPAQANANVTVYPNPTSDVLNISSKLEVLSSEIYNLGGQLVASYGAVSQLDIANLAKGNYILKINGKDKVYSQQIIKN